MANRGINRRGFLLETGLATTLTLRSAAGATGELPPRTRPRATDGDDRSEPSWDERFTLTVGTKNGDLVGNDDRVLQAAVDYVARMGGGTVKVLPGTFTLRNAVFLPSRLRLLGSGTESIITRILSERVAVSDDSNW